MIQVEVASFGDCYTGLGYLLEISNDFFFFDDSLENMEVHLDAKIEDDPSGPVYCNVR